jgi:hypothetical protein
MADSNDGSPGMYEGMVDNLVTQFSSALDCFRELVQNSIDAGSPRVEVWTEYLPGEGHEGTIAIHVDDFGEGMDEQIIDNQFTQLFASTKDDDLTKIGKFGIGFVSVFALQPRAVLVHTGRSGEYWEVLFHEDRSFSKTRVDNPVEGTQITLFLAGEYHRYQDLVEEIPATLRHWCSHSEVEVTFEDRTNNEDFAPPQVINEEFGVHGECLQYVQHEGTEIALAYSERPIYGFYNRGLTLALTDVGDDVLTRWKRRLEYVSFKIKSRYLEHTLSRDSVIRDEQYEKAMTLLEEAANGPLLDALIAELEELAGAPKWTIEEYHRYGRLLAILATEPTSEVVRHSSRPIFRCLNGPPMSIDDAWQELRQEGRVLVDRESSSVTDLLGKQGVPVISSGERSALDQFVAFRAGAGLPAVQALIPPLRRLAVNTPRGWLWSTMSQIGEWVRREDVGDHNRMDTRIAGKIMTPAEIYYPIELDDEVDDELGALLSEAQEILSRAGTKVRRLSSGVITSAGGEAPLFVVARRLAPLMARPVEDITATSRRFEAAINRNHPHFDVIIQTYRSDPSMGAYLLARGLSLSQDYKLEANRPMLDAALSEKRRQFQG